MNNSNDVLQETEQHSESNAIIRDIYLGRDNIITLKRRPRWKRILRIPINFYRHFMILQRGENIKGIHKRIVLAMQLSLLLLRD